MVPAAHPPSAINNGTFLAEVLSAKCEMIGDVTMQTMPYEVKISVVMRWVLVEGKPRRDSIMYGSIGTM